MKRTFYTLILLAILLQSCLPKDPKDYIGPGYALGTAEKIGDVSSITTDDSEKVIMKNVNFPDSIIGERVYAEGYKYKGNSGYDYALDADNCVAVPIKETQIVENQGAIDLINNASVSFDNNRVWQTGKYLNLVLGYYAADTKKHSFDFFINGQTEKFENNRVTINICHNNGGDNVAEKGYKSLFSLDLTNLFEEFTEDFDIKFVYIENTQKKEVIIKIKRRF